MVDQDSHAITSKLNSTKLSVLTVQCSGMSSFFSLFFFLSHLGGGGGTNPGTDYFRGFSTAQNFL